MDLPTDIILRFYLLLHLLWQARLQAFYMLIKKSLKKGKSIMIFSQGQNYYVGWLSPREVGPSKDWRKVPVFNSISSSTDVGSQIVSMNFKIPQSNEYKRNINNFSPA